LVLLTAVGLTFRAVADDQIVKTDGTTVTGRILGVSDGAATVEQHIGSGVGKFPVMIADIKSITMDTPPAVAQVEAPTTPPGQVISALQGPVDQFAGRVWVMPTRR
jgi:hypothetical protein